MESKWDNLFKDGGIHTNPAPDLYELADFMKSKRAKSVLDAGCGNGRDSLFLAKQGFIVNSIDSSKTAIETAKNKFYHENVKYEFGDITSFPYPDNCFDFVLAGHSIEYTGEKIGKAVSEIKRVLKKGFPIYARILSKEHLFYNKYPGELYGNSVLEYAIRNKIPISYFSETGIRDLFKEFKIEKLEHVKHEPSRKTGVALNEWILLAYKD